MGRNFLSPKISMLHNFYKGEHFTKKRLNDMIEAEGQPHLWFGITTKYQTFGNNLLEDAGFKIIETYRNGGGGRHLHFWIRYSIPEKRSRNTLYKYNYMDVSHNKDYLIRSVGFPICCGAAIRTGYGGDSRVSMISDEKALHKQILPWNRAIDKPLKIYDKLIVCHTERGQPILSRTLRNLGFKSSKPVTSHRLWWYLRKRSK